MSWPLVAVARQARLVMLHGAPNATLDSPAQLDRVVLNENPGPLPPTTVDELLGQILWARTATTRQARAFLKVIGPDLTVAIFGHDVVREGHVVEGDPLLCISSSFGCFDGDKVVLDWDLSEPASNAWEVAQRGLRRLYPDAAPVYRDPGIADWGGTEPSERAPIH
jgi:hypothetical protein